MEKLEQAQELADWKLCDYAVVKRDYIADSLDRMQGTLYTLLNEATDAREVELAAALKRILNWKG